MTEDHDSDAVEDVAENTDRELEGLLDGIQRIPWTQASALLRSVDLPIRRGWPKTIAALRKSSGEKDDIRENIMALKDIYVQNLLVGNKASWFYRLDRELCRKLFDQLEESTAADGPMKQAFPYPLPEEELEKLTDDIQPMAFYQGGANSGSEVLVTCSSRFYFERRTLTLTSDERETYDVGLADEVIAISRRFNQSFDGIFLHTEFTDEESDSMVVEIRIDQASDLSRDLLNRAHHKLKSFLAHHLKIVQLNAEELLIPLKLFNVIDKIYNDKSEGRVCDLGWTTDSDFVNYKTGRSADEDLRQEDFHRAGMEAVGERFYPFRLGVRWDWESISGIQITPELLLPGTSRMVDQVDKHLTYAQITGCLCESDYSGVLNRLFSRLKSPKLSQPTSDDDNCESSQEKD